MKLICTDCRKRFEVEKFVKGETKCPRCGFAAFVEEDKSTDTPPPQTKKKELKEVAVCTRCGIYWLPPITEEGVKNGCPKCGSTDWHIEYLQI